MNANASHLNPDAIDHTIDRALSALRDAQPRSGLESRILASLEHRTAEPATNPGGPSFHSLIVKGWGIVCGRGPLRACSLGWGSKRENANRTAHSALWVAASAAILAIASLIILHRPGAPPSTRIARQGGIAMPVPQVAPGLAAGFSPLNTRATKSGALAPAHSTPKPVILSEARRAQSKDLDGARRATNPESFSTTNATPTDAQLLADLHAPSHPAPPLPLTPQEKLFLRMLRYGNATQIAELDPMIRAKQDADETAAFKAFFPDPPPLQQSGDSE